MPNVVLGWMSGGSVAENSSSSVSLGFLDLDIAGFPAGVDTISIAPIDGVTFIVDSVTFEVIATGAFDFETTPLVSLSILVTYLDTTDNGGETLNLAITNVNEAPGVTSGASTTVALQSAASAPLRRAADGVVAMLTKPVRRPVASSFAAAGGLPSVRSSGTLGSPMRAPFRRRAPDSFCSVC